MARNTVVECGSYGRVRAVAERLTLLLTLALAMALAGCGASNPGDTTVGTGTGDSGSGAGMDAGFVTVMDGGHIGFDIRPLDHPTHDIQPNPDAFFANNPPPRFCGPDGGGVDVPHVTLPGGTAQCPDDLNREGCPCTTVGQTVPCWPGLRVNRHRGVCQDGMTTCMPYDELVGRWGPCMHYTLPTPGAVRGSGTCSCFSMGQWALQNTSPCLIGPPSPSAGPYYAVSTYVDAMGQAHCPDISMTPMPPFPVPAQAFSPNTLRVDCTGQFQLCYTIRAGDAMHPMASDCVVARTCTSAWYGSSGTTQTLPPLPGWSGADSACATRFVNTGGYGEMSVQGLSSECDHVDDHGAPYVFNRVTYCPSLCNDPAQSHNPMCVMCGNGGAGGF